MRMTLLQPDEFEMSQNPDQHIGCPSPGGTIDLWLFARDVDARERAIVAAHLSPKERARSQRFLDERDSYRYDVTRGRLREILSGYVGLPPAQIAFRYGDRGKPYLEVEPPVWFNLSHSADLAAVAVSTDFELGVDIERLRPVRRDLPDRYFSRSEAAALAALEGDAWRAAFFRCWTRKEAFIKALGEGMRQPLDSFSVSFGEAEPARLTWLAGDPEAAGNWSFLDVPPAEGFAGAITAMTSGAPTPRLRIRSRVSATARMPDVAAAAPPDKVGPGEN